MTLNARTAPVSESFSGTATDHDLPSLAEFMKGSSSTSRFNLRKRTVNEKPQVNLSSYNSAFLSGLFADVAKVASSQSDPSTTSAELPQDSDVRQDDAFVSIKRSRISLSRSISRCGRSFSNLQVAACRCDGASSPSPVSPLSPIEFFDIPATKTMTARRMQSNNTSSTSAAGSVFLDGDDEPSGVGRENSLTFQLHLVSSSSSEGEASPRSIVADIASIAFPHLPATVSDSSCNSSALSSGKVDQHVSTSETTTLVSSTKEAYGWFVEMEDDDSENPANISRGADLHTPFDRYAATTTNDLAFQAPTAPKQVNYDAEVEWAKAADTVDDVLGDFF